MTDRVKHIQVRVHGQQVSDHEIAHQRRVHRRVATFGGQPRDERQHTHAAFLGKHAQIPLIRFHHRGTGNLALEQHANAIQDVRLRRDGYELADHQVLCQVWVTHGVSLSRPE